ncbi:F-box/kelch-repeat protein At3g23880-like [Solanum verrucosum]|uniref:F-box/kelch-repeat protein At3g23880-like n=1 Tax=Solanum verrucosum TaxID=315347 RepID=UPI0020D078C7|nr:F-box/kelch-repeat protein At3g23880-like [Solanum verrucosum]
MLICFFYLLVLTFSQIMSKMLFARKFNGENLVSDSNRSNPANPSMPTEIIIEILSRVPVKSLLKFRCVSKSWLALISSPEFIKSHLSLSANNNIHLRNIEESNLDYLMKNLYISFLFEGSVNGLICLVNRAKNIYLWNPTIRKYKKLPDHKIEPRPLSRFIYGFGYDKIHDDYKVVLYNFDEVAMYSLKNDSWRRIDYPRNEGRLMNTGKFLNGKLYWATTNDLDLRVWSITSFDLTDEKWRKVERPCGNDILVLGVLESNLSIMIRSNATTNIEVWVMKEYENKVSWMKMFTINYTLDRVEYFIAQSFYLTKRGEFLVMFRPYHMIYNLNDNSIGCVDLRTFDFGLLTDFYIQSLVCPFSQN